MQNNLTNMYKDGKVGNVLEGKQPVPAEIQYMQHSHMRLSGW